MFYRLLIAFLASILAVTSLSGCGAALGALPTVLLVVNEALSIIQGIDRVAQEFFTRHPDVPTSTRMEYLQYSQAVQDALSVLQQAARGGEALNEGQTAEAFQAFQQAWDDLMLWLQNNGMRDTNGALVLDGKLVSEPLPSAKLMAQKAMAE